MLGIQSARELPVSFPELIFMHEDLRNLIDSFGSLGKGQTRNKHTICLEEAIVENVDQSMCESEKNPSKEPKAVFDGFQLSQHCAELVLNNFKDPNGVSRVSSLLASLGNVERALCQAYDVSKFADFGLKEGLFSEFLGRYGLSLAEGLGVDGHFPTITRFLKLCPSASPQQVAKHFLGFSEKELQKAMAQESQTAPKAVKVDSRPRELQVLLATCGWDTGAQQHAHPKCLSDEHRADLAMKAVEAIEQVPVLIDLHEALPEWNKKFLPLGEPRWFFGIRWDTSLGSWWTPSPASDRSPLWAVGSADGRLLFPLYKRLWWTKILGRLPQASYQDCSQMESKLQCIWEARHSRWVWARTARMFMILKIYHMI